MKIVSSHSCLSMTAFRTGHPLAKYKDFHMSVPSRAETRHRLNYVKRVDCLMSKRGYVRQSLSAPSDLRTLVVRNEPSHTTGNTSHKQILESRHRPLKKVIALGSVE